VTESLAGAPVAARLLETARGRVEALARAGRSAPTLASVHRDSGGPFSVYLRNQAKAAASAGIGFRPVPVPANAGAEALVSTLRALDADPEVHAVILEHPLPPPLDFGRAVAALRPEKDVDGVTPASLGRLAARRPMNVPAVARAALEVAAHYGIALAGRRVGVVGRSETVGVPLALLLLRKGAGGDATVTVAHSGTPDLAAALSGCQVIFGCAGHPGLLNRAVVPRGAAVIDIGLTTLPDPSRPSGLRMAGDADAASLEGWASALSPVPGGVGPVTVAALMANAVDSRELQGAFA
jgi:methylenetetrahydrofolate dehydrogenase (NADP+)/methenyltetrahydrofolate cyclohydrolase